MPAEEFAREFAERAHDAQKYGEFPYVVHLAAVRAVLADFGFNDEDFAVAAWLHDVLEDTPTEADFLELMFGSAVTHLVWAVTGKGKNRKERNADAYSKIADHPRAVPLKLADRIANVEATTKNSPRLLEMYRKEHASFKESLRVASYQASGYTGISEEQIAAMWARLDKAIAG
jgi:(p)ppGpp synthase/HD superfamily hydrolase